MEKRFIRPDDGAEFTATAVLKWLRDRNAGPANTKPASSWQNDFMESSNGKLYDECLSREWPVIRRGPAVAIGEWRQFHNSERPHFALVNWTPAQAGQLRWQSRGA